MIARRHLASNEAADLLFFKDKESATI